MGRETIFIEEKPFEAETSRNLLDVCLSLGFNLPYFCWHPALGSVGACRQCAVKLFRSAQDTKGRLVMACMSPVVKGMRISIEDGEAREFRRNIIEGLMQSHPHDCPVCDEGGECHLQDMTLMTGHDYRRYSFAKRTFQNQYLGPFVTHEMNRCIQCYRCVRFYRDYAGGRDLDAFGLRNLVYFGRKEDGILENEFAGNLAEVCPTGVFTDKTLAQHYTRKWDLQMAPSICVHCGLGCNISAAERYGELRRVINRYNGEVNRYFLCDRGRFGYQFVNSKARIRTARLRREGGVTAVSKPEILDLLGRLLASGEPVIGIGSPRASLETNFALRELVGERQFFSGFSLGESRLVNTALEILKSGPARIASLKDIENSDAVLILGEDITNTAARMALSVRQSVIQQPRRAAEKLGIWSWDDKAIREAMQDVHGPLFVASAAATRLDEVATETFRAAPNDIARLGFAVAQSLDPAAPRVPDLSSGLANELHSLAERIAQALRSAERPLIISGVSSGSEAVIQAAASVARALSALKPAGLAMVAPDCNSIGLALMGGRPLEEAFEAVTSNPAATVIIAENDLFRRAPAAGVERFLAGAAHVVALDYLETATTVKAEMIIPAGTFAESDGTFVSNEGRAQRFFQVFVPEGDIQESWRWLRDLMVAAGRHEGKVWQRLDDILDTMAEKVPALARARDAAPGSAFRIAGERIAREPERYSGRTAMHANVTVYEPKPPSDPDSPLAFSMEGALRQPPSPLIPYFWNPGWNSIQAVNKFQEEIAGPLRGGNPGIRLLDSDRDNAVRGCSPDVPDAFEARNGEWLIVPLYHIFGSDHLTHFAPAIAELTPEPYLGLNGEDARAMSLNPGDVIHVDFGEADLGAGDAASVRPLKMRIVPGLPRGIAGLPVGLPGTEWHALPAWGRISQAQ